MPQGGTLALKASNPGTGLVIELTYKPQAVQGGTASTSRSNIKNPPG